MLPASELTLLAASAAGIHHFVISIILAIMEHSFAQLRQDLAQAVLCLSSGNFSQAAAHSSQHLVQHSQAVKIGDSRSTCGRIWNLTTSIEIGLRIVDAFLVAFGKSSF